MDQHSIPESYVAYELTMEIFNSTFMSISAQCKSSCGVPFLRYYSESLDCHHAELFSVPSV